VRLDQATIEGLRAMIQVGGARQLAVGDLRADEFAELTWSGNPAHLRSIAAALQRAAQGLEDYLVARAPGGEPVAKMRIDYTSEADTGVFSQLATMGPLQGLGIATMLIGAGEQRVHDRGLAFAALGVEDNNPGYATSTRGSDTRRPAASTHPGKPRTTPASSGCTKPPLRFCASASDARALTTPRSARTRRSALPFLARPMPSLTGVSHSVMDLDVGEPHIANRCAVPIGSGAWN
jgi:GNAT superfamily N-acetyltransferase